MEVTSSGRLVRAVKGVSRENPMGVGGTLCHDFLGTSCAPAHVHNRMAIFNVLGAS